ncbi:hypothetical protein [Chitinophaga pinensis]|uniref:DUF5655 domain-containing protein n=1 Tax=Chitinophaga pinensis (strain ATCC 43595 / DSM 2588 / LMG 13176 / NBRC 15968 / NCIMB 11800 / UQM 2034) TaxID=485918 RepID=A0A979G4A0_CHIPD|nr:hypothetical protein [Chitinophaga pinensis]ACU60451.1 hypothetical protein Cpin_2974 [Chitinophaga pinensis DSM 2588]
MLSKLIQDKSTVTLFEAFIAGKSEQTLTLLSHLITQYQQLGDIYLYPTKSMLGIGIRDKRIAWITQLGKSFVHVVFPFTQPYNDNLCFQKIAPVPGDAHQFNHHFRMLAREDVNEEVLKFMQLSLAPG